ncbi:MAG: heavy metal translocating P-type ATPase [Frankiales bacterium]|nr:heavy metal translocating P-type ATPase [Frankiales bacterium]
MHHRFPLTLVALALVAAGCNNAEPQAALAPVVVPTTQPPVITQAPVVVPTTISPTPKPTPKPPTYDVKAVQTQLTALHYYIGAIDGERGASLRSAVMAFQKVQGLSADGGVGPKTLAALKAPKQPVLKGSGGGTRVEVDLTKQVLYLVKDGKIARILPVSSGNGKHYLTKSGHVATALSPIGYYKITRRILGERHADLGTLYDPQYFYKGWAIHGSNSVPAHPASHGCIRVTRTDAKYLLKQISVGTAVYIYGGAYTFTAGSAAPGTDDPGGDTAEPTPTPAPTTPAPTPTPTETPTTPPPTILPTP